MLPVCSPGTAWSRFLTTLCCPSVLYSVGSSACHGRFHYPGRYWLVLTTNRVGLVSSPRSGSSGFPLDWVAWVSTLVGLYRYGISSTAILLIFLPWSGLAWSLCLLGLLVGGWYLGAVFPNTCPGFSEYSDCWYDCPLDGVGGGSPGLAIPDERNPG